MPLNGLHANHIGAVGGGFELQRSNNGLLYIVNLDGNSNNIITLALATFPLPKETSAVIDVPFLNETRKFAGRVSYEDLTIVFNDYVDQETSTILAKWRALVKDPVTGKIGNKAQYAKTGRMVKYGPDGQHDREFELEGIWPMSFDPGEIDMGSDDGVKISMTLVVDKAIYIPAVPNLSAPAIF